jgi:thiol-disulfide isomerase/thioredoxin
LLKSKNLRERNLPHCSDPLPQSSSIFFSVLSFQSLNLDSSGLRERNLSKSETSSSIFDLFSGFMVEKYPKNLSSKSAEASLPLARAFPVRYHPFMRFHARVLAGFSLLLIAAAVQGQAKKTVLKEGDDAPKFTNPDISGKYLLSTKVYGTGWVIVDFFATWCVPCKAELPEVEKLYRKFETSKKLQAIIFDTDTDPSLVGPFFQSRPTPLIVVIDRYAVTSERFGVEALPTIFLVDPQGKIRLKATGETEAVAALGKMDEIFTREIGVPK